MPRYIIHHNGVYNEYTSVADGPCWEDGLTLEQLKDVIKEEHGSRGLEGLEARLKRAHEKGTSAVHSDSLADTVCVYLEHEEIALDEFIKRYLMIHPS